LPVEGEVEGDEVSSPEMRVGEESMVTADDVPGAEEPGVERDGLALERVVPFDESALEPVEPPDPFVSA
jgi:hypothetical protein